MDNPEIHTTMGTKHRTKAGNNNNKTIQKTKKMDNTKTTKNTGVNPCAREG
jgi:hypothetical protein